ncbi:MAG: DUF1513 domain-containing protein [Hyphomicrobium sp.]
MSTIAAVAIGATRTSALAQAKPEDVAFVSAAKRSDGSFVVLLLGADGRIVRELPLSARGHDVALHPASGRAVVFARRPGTFALAFNPATGASPQIFTAEPGRHFFGHGAFSHDGRLLYVSENDIDAARGVIGLYDVAAGYKKVGEHPSHGMGPHEIILLGDGRTLAVANGGLDTVPEAGRENLNTDAMEASLTFVDARSGALIAKHTLPPDLQRLSIRHIAVDAAGLVWFGAQWEGAQSETPQLIGSAGQDRVVRLIAPPTRELIDLKGYIGSMSASIDGTVIAASAPKAGRIVYIDAASGTFKATSVLKDACGIAGETGDTFAATSGFGVLRHEHAGAAVISEAQLANVAFDNHLRRWG